MKELCMKLDNKITQSILRKCNNKPWLEEEKGPHLKAYENSLTWPKDRPKLLTEVIERIKNNS
jgi:hypothetical protein